MAKINVLSIILMIMTVFFAFSGCSLDPPEKSDSVIRVGVPSGIAGNKVREFYLRYAGAGSTRVIVEVLSPAQYQDDVWSQLLSGQSAWDAILLDGRHIQELAQYRAIMRIDNVMKSRSSKLTELMVGQEIFGIPYFIDIPLVLRAVEPQSDDDNLSRSVPMTENILLENARIGLISDAPGVSPWLFSNWNPSTGSLELISPDHPLFGRVASALCDSTEENIDRRSLIWSAEDVITAVKAGEIDAGVLWLSQIYDLPGCSNQPKEGCFYLNGVTVMPLYAQGSPRMVTAWAIPINTNNSPDVLKFINAVPEFNGLDELNTNQASAIREAQDSSVDYAIKNEEMATELEKLIWSCLDGDLANTDFTIQYSMYYQDNIR